MPDSSDPDHDLLNLASLSHASFAPASFSPANSSPANSHPAKTSPIAARDAVLNLPASKFRYPTTAWDMDTDVLPMHLNEGPWPPSSKVVESIRRHAAEIFRYPIPQPLDLRTALADRCRVPASLIVLGNGSDELVQAIALAYVSPGDPVVIPAPSFAKYRQACSIMGGRIVQTGLLDDGRVDVRAICDACTADTRLVFIATPNNPTGGSISLNELEYLLERVSPNVLLVFDEAYHEFAVAAGSPDLLPTLAQSSTNWVILRSLSKAYCLAGLRIGYLLSGNAEIAEAVARVQPVFNISHLGRIAALSALADQTHLNNTVRMISEERERLRKILTQRGLSVLPSLANFLAIDFGRPARPLQKSLQDRRILTALIQDSGYESFLRVTIGRPGDNDRFLEALFKILDRDMALHPT
jgi:histidinol-phosphate aminotransferase